MEATSDVPQPRKPGLFEVLVTGLNMMRRTLIVGMPVTLCLGLISGLGTWTVTGLVPTLSASPPPESVFDGMLLLSGVLGLYTVLQLGKAYGGQNPPGLLSWIPCLFFLPSLFMLLGLWGVSGAATSLGPQASTVALMGFLFAFDLAVWPFLGAIGVLAWIGSAERLVSDEQGEGAALDWGEFDPSQLKPYLAYLGVALMLASAFLPWAQRVCDSCLPPTVDALSMGPAQMILAVFCAYAARRKSVWAFWWALCALIITAVFPMIQQYFNPMYVLEPGQGFQLFVVASILACVGGILASCPVSVLPWTKGKFAHARTIPRVARGSLGRFHQVAVPHGAALQAVSVGMQLLVPGIFYALQYAFVDCVAVLDPDRPALKHSGRLTWAIRGYLFRILFVWFLVAFGGAFLLTAVIDGFDNAATTLLMGPDRNFVSLRGVVVPEIFGVWCAWWSTMAMWVVYRWRLDQLSWKAARKRAQAAEEA